MVTTRHGKTNLHVHISERAGSSVPRRRSACFAEAQPASPASPECLVRASFAQSRQSINLNSSIIEANLFTEGSRCPCDVARIKISFTSALVPPNNLLFSVSHTDPRDYTSQRIPACFLRNSPSTGVIVRPNSIVHTIAPAKQELRSGYLYWKDPRQTLRRSLEGEE